jgi:flagellar biosynthesis/type III secretory pathway protein FliH
VQEVHDGTLLSNDLEIHTLELPKLADAKDIDPEEQAAHEWAQFLAAETDQERRRLGMANSDIHKANEALDELSQDPHARDLARWREDQLRLYRVELATAERRGREEGQRRLVRRQLETKFGVLDATLVARLAAADLATLDRYAERLLTAASLDDVFAK